MEQDRVRRLAAFALLAAMVAGTSMVFAQRIWVGGGGFRRTPPKWAVHESFDGSFNYCRGFYTSDRREAGGTGWDTDFPGADNNFSVRFAELTMVNVRVDETGQPEYPRIIRQRLAGNFQFSQSTVIIEVSPIKVLPTREVSFTSIRTEARGRLKGCFR